MKLTGSKSWDSNL